MPTAEATRRAWISGAILGLLILISLWGIGDYSFLAGLFLGIVGAVITALVLIWMSLGGEGMDAAQWEPDALSGTGQAAAQTLDVIEPQPSPKPAVQETAQEISDLKAKSASAPAKPVDKAEPDDLKLIKGVGPKLEELLLENGVTQFSQIAAWDDAQVDHFAEVLGRMGGRIRSDDWVAQAQTLASGGETEFSARVEKGEVY